jgi:hypothetical protein
MDKNNSFGCNLSFVLRLLVSQVVYLNGIARGYVEQGQIYGTKPEGVTLFLRILQIQFKGIDHTDEFFSLCCIAVSEKEQHPCKKKNSGRAPIPH